MTHTLHCVHTYMLYYVITTLIGMAPSPPASNRSSLYIVNSNRSSSSADATTSAATALGNNKQSTTVPFEIWRLVEAITDDGGSRLSEEGIFAEVKARSSSYKRTFVLIQIVIAHIILYCIISSLH
jgi:hypothetical protein